VKLCELRVFCSFIGRVRFFLSSHVSLQVKCTSGCALIIACRLVACGSSVYVQKKSSVLLAAAVEEACSFACGAIFKPAAVCCDIDTVAVETEEDMVANVCGCGVCVKSWSKTAKRGASCCSRMMASAEAR
jgi:hypothetical protein